MFEISDILFHKVYGFGIIKRIDSSIATIRFTNDQEKKIFVDHPSLILVNRTIVDKIIKSNSNNYFNSWTITKSKSYLQDINIYDVTENSIAANVYGNMRYLTIVRLNNNKLTFSCDCPVTGTCKHEAALYNFLKNAFTKLTETAEHKMDNEELLQSVELINEGRSTFLNRIKICDLLLENTNIHTIKTVIDKLKSNSYSYDYYRRNTSKQAKEFINYMLLNDEIRKIVDDNLSLFSSSENYKNITKAIKTAENIMYSQSINDILTYLFANKRYKEYIIKSLNYDSYNRGNYIVEACTRATLDDELIRVLKTHKFNNIDDSVYRPIIIKMSFDDIFDMVKENKFNLQYRDISKYTKEQKIKLLPYIIPTNYDICEIIENDFINDVDDKTKATIVASAEKSQLNNKQKTKLLAFAKKLENSKYLQEYIKKDAGRYTYHYYWYDDNYYFLKENEKFNIDEKEFFAYFKEEYVVIRDDDEIKLRCYLKLLNGKTIIEVITSKDEYIIKENSFDGNNESVYIRYLIDYIKRKHNEDIQQETNKILQEIKEEKDAERSRYALSSLNAITNNETATIKLTDNKAQLEYYFDIDERNRHILSLKVGINKMYVVKNVYQFFEDFSKCSNVEYGKNFVLTHDIDNFNEKDAKIINEFLKTSIYSENRKDLIITSNMFDFLIDELKNHTVFYKKKPYNLRLEEKKMFFNVDKDYRIQLRDNLDYNCYLFTDKNIYLLNEKEEYIDCIYSNYKDAQIIAFLLRNIDTNIKPLLNEFKEIVYYDYQDIVTIDESIKKDFYIADISIKAYFDYEDSIIKCRSEYYIDNKEVKIDHIKEKYNITKLNKYHNYLSGLGFEDDILVNDGKILNFFYMDFSELKKYCEVYLSESIQNKKVTYFAPAKIQIQCQSNIMQAFVEESKYSDEELYKILAAIKKKKKFIVMQDDRIIDLTNKDAKDFNDTVEELNLNKKKLTESTSLPIAKALKAIAHQNSCNIDDYLLNMINDISNFKNANIKLPSINATLRDYQREGFNWLSILSKYNIGGILADDMGLGKTIETIALILSDNQKRPNLVICPKSVVFNWKNEFKKFAPDEKVIEIYGLKKQRESIIKSIKQKEKATYIVSYDSLRNDIEMYKTEFNHIVLDEAQYIKNVNAQKTNNVKRLKGTHRLALTGTPIENNIIDLWSIFDFVIPGYFEKIEEFKSRYSNDENYTNIISKRIAPFILRRNKKDVLKDLPEKYEHIIAAEMSESQRKVYDAYVMKAKEKINEGLGAFDILPYLTRLRQICIDPKIFIENYEGDSGKMAMLKQIIVDYISSNHKMMIVSQFVQALGEIETMLKELNIPYFLITGSVDAKKRMEICNKFNNDSEEKIVLVSLKAGGTGINLIGADTVIHLDPWWNIAATDQATDRTHRIGQKRNVEVIKLISENSIEQRVIELQNIKKDLIDKVISNNDSSVTNASIEDIKFILN